MLGTVGFKRIVVESWESVVAASFTLSERLLGSAWELVEGSI